VKLGISLGSVNPRFWVPVTEAADRLGFESVWIPEHLIFPVGGQGSPHHGQEHPPVPADIPTFDAFVYMGLLAGRTERVRFGTQVYNIGLRHPFSTARAVATLDVISNGRVELGIGASWLKEEWDAVGLDFATRGRRVDEAIEICQLLWTEKVVEYHGEHFDFGPVMFEPKPVQSPIPLHIGGDGKAALRRAATVGAGWLPMNHSVEQLPEAMARIAELRRAAGRDDPVELTVALPIEGKDDLERYAEAGITRVIARPWTSSKEAIPGMERFAEELLPVAAAL